MKTFTEDVLREGLDIGLPIVKQQARKERDAEWVAAIEESDNQLEDILKRYSEIDAPIAKALLKGQRKALRELLTRMEVTK